MATTNLSYYDKASIPNSKSFRFGIVVSEWNPEITKNLQEGAIETLLDCGAEKNNIVSWDVPGSFELVYGCKKMIESQKVDAIIAIGNVIQGETKHFDFVCDGVTQGIVDLNIKYDVPVIFCVLTDNTKQQSIDRSGGKLGNKGIECAVAAIKMAAIKNLDTPSNPLGF
ncbi:6,7-dimethyl-8-ribityllumazine synthase [Tenacibaculum ovolyticum]|uniref:6,7-dimethyl-8-ribityllumazine synthase n=1 Tax=Tenacibaculum ovolyticum TaxID=104270 RepID=UPI0022F3F458|nr:6,7-dimethyl-8-ribityllumazine synthase [Tenacibaculum ovolyticum]WBX77703.1 6,7-dimethyl-8-ribityllumazine synthase [Tenacibaculum ovolyticum]